MNQAGACYLVGLAWELEAVDLLAQNTKEARGRSKGKGREGHGDLAEGEAELMSRVESLVRTLILVMVILLLLVESSNQGCVCSNNPSEAYVHCLHRVVP